MKQDDFRVVAELYRFLATFEPSAISAASELPNISQNLRTALVALHRETASQRAARSVSDAASNNSVKKKNGGSLDPLGLLMDKTRFPAKQDLLTLAKLLGVKVKADAKDSRDRVARRIAAIASDDRAVCERLYDLLGAAKDTQTAGWVEIIRRGS